jgi:hypothetical protein
MLAHSSHSGEPAGSETTARAPSYQPVRVGAADGVLVPKEKASEFWHLQGRNQPPTDYWTPAQEDVQPLEERLAAFVQKAAPARSPELWKKLDGYKRQYVGLVLAGRKVIYANFVCTSVVEESFPNWQSQPVQVDDGGDCFFQVDYDVESGEFSNLMVHGEA